MGSAAQDQEFIPRIVPTPCHIRAIQGPWSLDGKVFRLYEEPETGVLLALNEEGIRENPLKVISRGKKLGAPEEEKPPTAY